MKFKYANLIDNPTENDIKAEINRLQHRANDYNNLQMAIKIFLNSMYGATASPYFVGYNQQLSEAITLQGQDIIKFAAKISNTYFKEYWHKDKKLHAQLGITTDVFPVSENVTIYGDTDSCDKDIIINTNKGILTIEELYNESKESAGYTIHGHESVKSNRKILNYDNNNQIVFHNIARVIRHKVTKPKWKLKTKKGKEITVTCDHSMIVFRDGKKLVIKPNEILRTDKILIIAKLKTNNDSI